MLRQENRTPRRRRPPDAETESDNILDAAIDCAIDVLKHRPSQHD
jgi:hypothetical protein